MGKNSEHVHSFDSAGMCACGAAHNQGAGQDRDNFGDRFSPISDDAQPVNFSLDPFVGAAWTPRQTVADLDQVISQIDSGEANPANNGVITFTFADKPIGNTKDWSYSNGFSEFSDLQKQYAREAMEFWDDVLAVEFREMNGLGADIALANSMDPGQAYAYYPQYQDFFNAKGFKFFGDVFIKDPAANITNNWFTPGGYGQTTMIHEIGHAIGLSHPGAYNGAGATDYFSQAEYAQDSMQYSIMSYWSNANTHPLGVPMYNPLTMQLNYAQTPMIHDILAAQSKYGADMTTRTGDTVYGFGSNAGSWVFDFEQNPYPYMAIWDAGGNDTIDASGFLRAGQYIDLNEGAFSSIGEGIPTAEEYTAGREAFNEMLGLNFSTNLTQARIDIMQSYIDANEFTISAVHGIDGIAAMNYDNVGIAYGVTIENAIGGQQRDAIFGNQVDNMLDGQAGDDVIDGRAGDDLIIGGLGADTLTGGEGADTFAFSDLELGDLITDFDGSEGDMIDLSAFADDLGSDLSFIADAAFSGTAGEVRFDGGMLSMDANGDGAADFQVAIANGADVDASMLALTMSA